MKEARRSTMIFAAGFGSRMGALTKDIPKPLLTVGGTTLLEIAVDIARVAGSQKIIVNTHYHAEKIEALLAKADVVTMREEPSILDTGGGLKNALPRLGSGPVFTLNPDAGWVGPNPLSILEKAWRPDEMSALLLIVPHQSAEAHLGSGDFDMDDSGRLSRGTNFIYTGAQIIDTSGLAEISKSKFSLNEYWNQLSEKRGINGIVYPGIWCDVGHPAGLERANSMLRSTPSV